MANWAPWGRGGVRALEVPFPAGVARGATGRWGTRLIFLSSQHVLRQEPSIPVWFEVGGVETKAFPLGASGGCCGALSGTDDGLKIPEARGCERFGSPMAFISSPRLDLWFGVPSVLAEGGTRAQHSEWLEHASQGAPSSAIERHSLQVRPESQRM